MTVSSWGARNMVEQRPKRRVWSVVFCVGALAVAGCSSSATSAGEVPSPSENTSSTTSTTVAATTVVETTVLETTSTTATSTTVTEPASDLDPQLAAVVWTELLAAAGQLSVDDTAGLVLASNATVEVAEQLRSIYGETTARPTTAFPVVEVTEAGVVTIEDCAVVTVPITVAPVVWFSGTAVEVAGEWVIDSINVKSLDGCAPGPLAAETIAAYDAHWDARSAYLDPPDPVSPLIAETTSGVYRDLMVSLAERFANDGQFLRDRPPTNPEVWRVDGVNQVILIDCHRTNPERGVYDATTGERTDLIPSIVDEQMDLLEATMVLEDGLWKVDDLQANEDTTCEPAPSSKGLPVVGQ